MPAMSPVTELVPAIVLLTAGIAAILLARPLRMSPIVGYIVAGMALGPNGLDLIPEGDTTNLLAELGVAFLLFDIGLTFSVQHVWDARRDILGLGPLQCAIATIAFAVIGAMAGLPTRYAIVIGAALALSSSAAVVQTLNERGMQSCPVGLTATAILVFQDVAAIFLLILIASFGETSSVSLAQTLASAAVNAAIAFVAAVAIGRYGIGSLFALLSRSRNNEIFTATALLIVLATAAATQAIGLSLALGAFLGGMMLAETPYRQLIQTEIKPFRGLLLGFFFITVGMPLAPAALLADGGWVLLFLIGYIAIKAVCNALASLAFRWSVPGSIQLGLLLAQGDEFAFVLFADAGLRGALGERAAGVIITGVAVSLALTPALATAGRELARRLRAATSVGAPATGAPAGIEPVVIVGMGDIGRTVADGLQANRIAYLAVEFDPDRFATARADGYPVAFGDPGDSRLIDTLEVERRSAIAVTIVRYEVSAALTPLMRDRYPHVVRFVAVDTEEERARFAALGMHPVITRSVPRGLDLAAAVLVHQRVGRRASAAWMQREQQRALEAMAQTRAPMPAPAAAQAQSRST